MSANEFFFLLGVAILSGFMAFARRKQAGPIEKTVWLVLMLGCAISAAFAP